MTVHTEQAIHPKTPEIFAKNDSIHGLIPRVGGADYENVRDIAGQLVGEILRLSRG